MKKQRILSLLCCIVLLIATLSVTVWAADNVPYLDANGALQTCATATEVTADTTAWSDGWYVVNSDVTISTRVTVSGTVHLILTDGCTLTATGGIQVQSSDALTIYGQMAGTGKLTANVTVSGNAAIGGNNMGSGGAGSITINGGTIEATSANGAGIGGGYTGSGGSITINGGTVTASSTIQGAGIGGGGSFAAGGSGGSITINGGTVTATGAGGAGIGGGYGGNAGGSGGNIVITGGTVKATSDGGAGIGSGSGGNGAIGSGGSTTISGGTITAVGKCAFSVQPTVNAGLKTSAGTSESNLTGVEKTGLEDATYTGNTAVKIEPCAPHEAISAVYIDKNKHTASCKWCGNVSEEDHSFDESGTCVCGYVNVVIKVPYIDENGAEQTAVCDAAITADNIGSYGTLTTGWYVVRGEVTAYSRITVSGDVRLILADDCNFTVNGGISVNEGNSLTIYAQSTGESMGKLTTQKGSNRNAGIGSDNEKNCGTIIINGGNVTANGNGFAAGIGSGTKGNCGTITINGGSVKANGGNWGAGIGSGDTSPAGGSITINGGYVEATGGELSAGIGTGVISYECSITITGGTVNATGGQYGAGIGGGNNNGADPNYGAGGTITISGGTVTANGGKYGGAGIGGGSRGTGGTITITGGNITATGSSYTAGIGHGDGGSGGTIRIDGGTVLSVGGTDAYAYSFEPIVKESLKVSVGESEDALTGVLKTDLTDATYTGNKVVKIEACATHKLGTTVYKDADYHTATCKLCGAEIEEAHSFDGNGQCTGCGICLADYLDADGSRQTAVCDGVITADNIGSYGTLTTGWYVVKGEVAADSRITVSGTVHLILADGYTLTASKGITVEGRNSLTIYGQENGTGNLTAESENQYASIGSRDSQTAGTITINGGIVNATGNIYAAGIGGGGSGNGGTITINDGTVTANGGYSGAGIGGGNNGNGGTITIKGGTVIANGGNGSNGNSGAGIGGNGGTITIKAGTVTATGGNGSNSHSGGAGIRGGTITISGGTVTATGGGHGPYGGGNGEGIGSTFSTDTNGKAVIFATSISDQSGKTGGTWSGVIFEGDAGQVYGTTITPIENFTIESGKSLLIPTGSTLNISGITAINNGSVYVDGTVSGLDGDLYYPLSVTGGTADKTYTYNGSTYGKAGETVTLTATGVPVGQAVEGWTASDAAVTVENNAFTMPSNALTVSVSGYVNAPTYTVTIPATVELGGTATISAEGVNIVSGSQLVVTLTDAQGFKLKTDDGAELSYNITQSGVKISEGETVLTVAGGTANASGSTTLTFTAPTAAVKYSGEYKGTVTFTVAVQDGGIS